MQYITPIPIEAVSALRPTRLLDLDLDFFLDHHVPCDSRSGRRLNPTFATPWPRLQVIDFLEKQCGLNKSHRPGGYVIEHHDEVFALIDSGQIVAPVALTHVDSHADFGFGECSWPFLMSEMLAVEPTRRPRAILESGRLTAGNFLAMCAACRWISDLTYVPHPEEGGGYDIYDFFFSQLDYEAGDIQLKRCRPEDVDAISSLDRGTRLAWLNDTPREWLEPPIPFGRTSRDEYQASGAFDAIVLSRSPGCTPPESDALIAVIREYLR